MKNKICCFALALSFILQTGCNRDNSSIERIVIDFPHGETRLHVWKSGEARLFYGARPQHKKIKNNTFDLADLYKQLKSRLHDNVPRERWPNPQSTAGMVTITLSDQTETDYLIFDEEQLTERLFSKARKNILGQIP